MLFNLTEVTAQANQIESQPKVPHCESKWRQKQTLLYKKAVLSKIKTFKSLENQSHLKTYSLQKSDEPGVCFNVEKKTASIKVCEEENQYDSLASNDLFENLWYKCKAYYFFFKAFSHYYNQMKLICRQLVPAGREATFVCYYLLSFCMWSIITTIKYRFSTEKDKLMGHLQSYRCRWWNNVRELSQSFRVVTQPSLWFRKAMIDTAYTSLGWKEAQNQGCFVVSREGF